MEDSSGEAPTESQKEALILDSGDARLAVDKFLDKMLIKSPTESVYDVLPCDPIRLDLTVFRSTQPSLNLPNTAPAIDEAASIIKSESQACFGTSYKFSTLEKWDEEADQAANRGLDRVVGLARDVNIKKD